MPDYAAHHARPEADRDDLRFARLIAPLLGDGYALAQALSTDRGSAQDAVQAAALRAWQRMGQLREDGKARAWFLAIVVNECRSSWRKRRAVPMDVESSNEAIRWPAGIDQRLDVRSAMGQLKRDDRVVLSLRFLMDLTVDETAAVLAISPSAVKARTARAATRFRQLLKDEATS
jgi:RNA polymerase sigma-70 factor, ECF subfamily